MIWKTEIPIRTMIIPAAGYGTRMREITRGRSKELVCVGRQPALMYALQEAIWAGLTQVGIIIRAQKKDIIRVIQNDQRLAAIRSKLNIEFFMQENPTGEVGAIATASRWLNNEPFLVYYPDNIIVNSKQVLRTLATRFTHLGKDIVLLTSSIKYAQAAPCGLVPVEEGLYKVTPESPTEFPYGLRTTGIYAASAAFLDTCRELLKKNTRIKEIKDWDVRSRMAEKNQYTLGLDLGANVLDIGNPQGYKLAQAIFSKQGYNKQRG